MYFKFIQKKCGDGEKNEAWKEGKRKKKEGWRERERQKKEGRNTGKNNFLGNENYLNF